MGKSKNIRLSLTFGEDFEFAPLIPEQFLVRAMERGRPIYITQDFLERLSDIKPDELVQKIIDDLKKDSSSEVQDPALTWFYLFMDFREDFPRLMQLLSSSESEG